MGCLSAISHITILCKFRHWSRPKILYATFLKVLAIIAETVMVKISLKQKVFCQV